MLKIAITGNIASGKSLFEKYLKEAGFKVLCLDNATHFLYEKSDILKDFLLKKFNTNDRKKIADIVFNNPTLKKELEDFIYPLISDEMNKFFMENRGEKFLFVSAALLFEAGFNRYFDKTVLIKADENIRLKRLIKRNNLSKIKAMKRIKAQMPESTKITKADFIIDNSGDENALKAAADRFIKSLDTLL